MPHCFNSKRLRDRALFAQWDKRDEGAGFPSQRHPRCREAGAKAACRDGGKSVAGWATRGTTPIGVVQPGV